MAFKLNISEKGKAWKLETESEDLVGKKIGDKVQGKEIKPELEGFELEITGTSDKSGFPGMRGLDSQNQKRVLLEYGFGMHKKPKGLKKKKPNRKPNGLRLRKTVRGDIISKETAQINFNVLKSGSKKLSEIFPEQNQPKAPKATASAETAATPAPVAAQ